MNIINIANAAQPNISVNISMLDSILQASLIVQLILLVLCGLSIVCWAVGISKYMLFKSMRTENDVFINRFFKSQSLDSLYENLDKYEHSPLAHIFKAGYLELQKLAESHANTSQSKDKFPKLSGIDNLERALRKAMDNEISQMESRMNWLATTGSTGPFIGLFGTVWGIMGSFHKIGATGSASLAVVAPGISEALVTTAIGLAAAIPAVALYNHFNTQLRKQEIDLNNFCTDFLNITKRNFFKSE
jgi:biopolymer transport protein TolQ